MNPCLVVYDIADPKRLRRVAKVMEGYGVRVQKSVFECDLGDAARARMLRDVEKWMVGDEDHLRLYPLTERLLVGAQVLGMASSRLPPAAVVV